MKTVLTIAGSDCSGGAGIQADIKTITVHKMYAMSVITALTAQNTTGVYDVLNVTPLFLEKQLECIFTDIFPDSIKIGMVSDSNLIISIVKYLREYNASNIVIDPVMISSSGSSLLTKDALSKLTEHLLPLGTVITPNIPEAEVLCNMKIKNEEDMYKAAEVASAKFGTSVLIKGGHKNGEAADILFSENKFSRFCSERVDTRNTHGTGCTLSSAIACGLADGLTVDKSICKAKQYLTGALKAMMDIGSGSGPINHMYMI